MINNENGDKNDRFTKKIYHERMREDDENKRVNKKELY